MRVLSLIIVALLIVGSSGAQSLPAAELSIQAAPKPGDAQKLNRKALILLDEIIGEAHGLRLAENRAFVLMEVADLYWVHDSKLAQTLFREAAGTIWAGMNAIDGNVQSDIREVLEQLEEDLIKMVARRDARFALELLRTPDRISTRLENENKYAQMEDALIAEAVASEPQQAVSVAEDSLARGRYGRVIQIITKLQKTDYEAAAGLARKLLAKLRSGNSQSAQGDGVEATFALLGVVAKSRGGTGEAHAQPSLLLDQPSVRALVEMTVTVAASSDDPDLLLTLSPALRDVETVMPLLAPSLRQRLDELVRTFGEPEEDDYLSDDKQNREAREEGSRADSIGKRIDELIEFAITKAAEGNVDAARKALDEARQFVGLPAKNSGHLKALLKIAFAYAEVDTAQAFQLIESIAEQMNFLAEVTNLVGGFFAQGFEREDELLIRPIKESTFTLLGDDLRGISTLARVDFERLVAASGRINHTEARSLARLLIAQSVLKHQSPLTKLN